MYNCLTSKVQKAHLITNQMLIKQLGCFLKNHKFINNYFKSMNECSFHFKQLKKSVYDQLDWIERMILRVSRYSEEHFCGLLNLADGGCFPNSASGWSFELEYSLRAFLQVPKNCLFNPKETYHIFGTNSVFLVNAIPNPDYNKQEQLLGWIRRKLSFTSR